MIIKRLPVTGLDFRNAPDIGGKIRTARVECGLSQEELALLVGHKTGTAISLFESNKRKLTPVGLWKIAQVTNLPIEYFFDLPTKLNK